MVIDMGLPISIEKSQVMIKNGSASALPNLPGVTVEQVLAESMAVRKVVSTFSNEKRDQLTAAARALINGAAKKTHRP